MPDLNSTPESTPRYEFSELWGGSITTLWPSQHHHSHRAAFLTVTPLNFRSLLRENDRDYDAQNFRIFISHHYLPPHLKRKKSMTCCGAHPRCWHGIAQNTNFKGSIPILRGSTPMSFCRWDQLGQFRASKHCATTLSMSCRWWLNTLFKKFLDKSLMIDFNLEQFANSPANLKHVSLYFDHLVEKNGTLSVIFHGIFLVPCEYMRAQVDA